MKLHILFDFPDYSHVRHQFINVLNDIKYHSLR